MNPFEGIEGPISAYASVAELPPLPVVTVFHRDRSDQNLMAQLSGLQGWIWSHAPKGGGPPTMPIAHAMEHCWRVQHQVDFEVTPGSEQSVIAWAEAANALLFFPDDTLRTARGETLVGGPPTEGADVPYTRDGQQRKARTEATLQAQGVGIAPHLPPSPGVTEVCLRDPEEVRARARALITVALRASSLAEGQPISIADLTARFGEGTLTEREASFLATEAPPSEALPQFSWRFEALTALLWALGELEELTAPTHICDTGQLIRMMSSPSTEAPTLRSVAAILDAVDFHYRVHWWVRNCEGIGQPCPFLNSVVHERRVALLWLIRLGEIPWEQMPLPT